MIGRAIRLHAPGEPERLLSRSERESISLREREIRRSDWRQRVHMTRQFRTTQGVRDSFPCCEEIQSRCVSRAFRPFTQQRVYAVTAIVRRYRSGLRRLRASAGERAYAGIGSVVVGQEVLLPLEVSGIPVETQIGMGAE